MKRMEAINGSESAAPEPQERNGLTLLSAGYAELLLTSVQEWDLESLIKAEKYFCCDDNFWKKKLNVLTSMSEMSVWQFACLQTVSRAGFVLNFLFSVCSCSFCSFSLWGGSMQPFNAVNFETEITKWFFYSASKRRGKKASLKCTEKWQVTIV